MHADDAEASARVEIGLEELMAAYQQAHAGAAATLVDRLSPRLYRFFANKLGSRADADDMLQEMWLRIHQLRHTYRPGAPLLPWLYAIAHRVRVDNYRKRRRTSWEVGVDVLPEPASQGCGPPTATEFRDLLAPLPESQRDVLSMLKVDGLSIEEIARATISTPGAVKQKAHRAYTRLRRVLQNAGIPAGKASGR
jgi:RNA polymerase sigma-70 factor (ECF subfamily)